MVKRLMGWLRSWGRSGKAGREQSVVPAGINADYDRALLRKSGLRPGMWVHHRGQVGILTGLTADGKARFHRVDPETGCNWVEGMIGLARIDYVRQATYDEIPVARRPSEEVALQMGYLVRER